MKTAPFVAPSELASRACWVAMSKEKESEQMQIAKKKVFLPQAGTM